MKYLVATVSDVNEASNFYYSVAPFEDIQGNISDVENLKLTFFTALDHHVAERKL